jgi:hypothetical protein
MITKMIRVRSVLFVSALSILLSSSAQAASITLDANGILLGAKDVIVNGSPYDVDFIEGTCAEVFGACDVAHFTFTSESDAHAASIALLEQVFLDGALGNFDSNLKLTNGCNTAWDIDQCFVFTPYGTFTDAFGDTVRIGIALNTVDPLADLNAPIPIVDEVFASHVPFHYDGATDPEGVFAKWTAVPQSVPDDTSALALAGLSLAIIVTMRRAV